MTPTVGAVDANGIRFATLTWGEGPLVLCLHGFPDSARTWDVVGPGIARAGYRVVAPYLRGYPPRQGIRWVANTLGGVVVWGIDCAGNDPAARRGG